MDSKGSKASSVNDSELDNNQNAPVKGQNYEGSYLSEGENIENAHL